MGGQPGEFPTVLSGTIFYHGHKIVQDEDLGLFDRDKAEMLVNKQAQFAQETGNPAILHIYAKTIDAFEKYMEFVDPIWNGPFIMDSADLSVRAAAAILVSEVGYADRAIYNSISMATDASEEAALRDSEVDCAILLAYNPTETGVDGSLKVLETGGSVKLAASSGFTRVLVPVPQSKKTQAFQLQ